MIFFPSLFFPQNSFVAVTLMDNDQMKLFRHFPKNMWPQLNNLKVMFDGTIVFNLNMDNLERNMKVLIVNY